MLILVDIIVVVPVNKVVLKRGKVHQYGYNSDKEGNERNSCFILGKWHLQLSV
jgi:hypothetical protein